MLLALGTAFAVAVVSPADARRHHHRVSALPVGLTDPSKDAALIVDGETGKVLYARNADAERHPASLTKMMTLYLLFDALKKGQLTLSTPLTVSAHAAAQKPTNLHMYKGETLTVDKAIKAIVVRSANDVAVVISEALGGTEAHFAELMTAKARALGMRDTFYHNASGLPDNLQITSANDLAILARHLAYDFPQYFHYFSTPAFSFHGTEYVTHDNLIGRYPGADGMKTGYTGASGFNLVSSVVRDNAHIIGVVMGGRTAQRRDKEMVALLDQTFASIERDPSLVAHAEVPWRNVAVNVTPMPSLAGSGSVYALPRSTSGPVTDADDEDTAESRLDQDEVAAAPAAPGPTSAQPAAKPETVVASYQPRAAAAPVAATPKPDVGEGDVGDAGSPTASLGLHDWTIQIGAYADMNLARSQLAAYAEKSMDMLGQAQRIVVPFQSVDGETLYRARFGPFLEKEAREICARLTERGQTCFAAISTR
jgi:D-alanyl-D-alanine carboxypeptidase